MMNNTNKPTVSKSAPWTVSVNGKVIGIYPTRTAARNAVKAPDLTASGADDGGALKALRVERKISVEALALLMGVSRYNVHRVERGDVEVSADYVEAFNTAIATA